MYRQECRYAGRITRPTNSSRPAYKLKHSNTKRSTTAIQIGGRDSGKREEDFFEPRLTLRKSAWEVPQEVAFGPDRLVPMGAGEVMQWKVV